MGRIIIVAALVTIGVIVAAFIGGLVSKYRTRLPPPAALPAAWQRPRGRTRDLLLGLGILIALILIGFAIKSPY